MPVPTLADEINRKTVEAIKELLIDYQSGAIGYSEVYYAARALWTATAGLTSPIINDVIANLKPHHPSQTPQ